MGDVVMVTDKPTCLAQNLGEGLLGGAKVSDTASVTVYPGGGGPEGCAEAGGERVRAGPDRQVRGEQGDARRPAPGDLRGQLRPLPDGDRRHLRVPEQLHRLREPG